MEAFRGVDPDVTFAVLDTLGRHMDFLAPEYSFLSLISKKVPLAEKLEIAEAIQQSADSSPLRPAPLTHVADIDHETKLHHLSQVALIFPFNF